MFKDLWSWLCESVYSYVLCERWRCGDMKAYNRLRALCRMQARREVKDMLQTVEMIRQLGMDPTEYVNAWCRAKVAEWERLYL